MAWNDWEMRWKLHARSPAFKTAVRNAVDVCRGAMRHEKLFCSLSGGKDSVAMAGVIQEAGLADRVPLVHAHCELNFPDTMDVVQATAEKLDMDLEVVEPDNLEHHVKRAAKHYGVTPPQPGVDGYTVLDLLRVIPEHLDVVDQMKNVLGAFAAGNMMVAYMYEHEYAGSFVGLRADESRGRAAYAKFRGFDYRNQVDGTNQVCPLLGWSADDVYAYLVTRGLPVHPYYRAAHERFGAEPGRTRVDISIACLPLIMASGSWAMVRAVYPATAQRLENIRPELRAYR